eukprot:gene14150-biopygen3609
MQGMFRRCYDVISMAEFCSDWINPPGEDYASWPPGNGWGSPARASECVPFRGDQFDLQAADDAQRRVSYGTSRVLIIRVPSGSPSSPARSPSIIGAGSSIGILSSALGVAAWRALPWT